MQRRHFLRTTALSTGGFVLGFPSVNLFASTKRADLVLVKNGKPAEMIQKTFELLGGVSRFVKPGQTVVIKPNIGWDRAPEFGANTHPEVAAEVVRQCLAAGAKRVLAFDRSCNNARRCYINSGLETAMSDAGAKVRFMHERRFETVKIPEGIALKEWDFYRDALEADVFINLPVLKHHSLSTLTMGMKNIMGVIGGERGNIHKDFNKKIVDLNRALKPTLTILDGVRFLHRNGPSGGSLGDITALNTIVAGVDPVLVDAWGAKVVGVDPKRLAWLRYGHMAGLGTMDTETHLPLEYIFVS